MEFIKKFRYYGEIRLYESFHSEKIAFVFSFVKIFHRICERFYGEFELDPPQKGGNYCFWRENLSILAENETEVGFNGS